MAKGIEFTMRDGTKECYDPIDNNHNDFKESESSFTFWIGGYDYIINKEDIISYKYYETE